MKFELTAQQHQLVAEQNGCPIEVVDPQTQRPYVLLPREEYERLCQQPRGSWWTTPQSPDEIVQIPPGIRRSQEALRRALPELLTQRKLQGKWICYAGEERIGIASTKTELMKICLQRGLDDDAYYIGIIEPYELIEEEELDPPPPWYMEEGRNVHP